MKSLSIGIDINEDCAQICYYDEEKDRVESVSYIKGESRFAIPYLPEEKEQEDFSLLFRRLIRLLKDTVGSFEIDRIGIAIEKKDAKTLDKLGKTLANLEISPKKVDIVNYDESFIYYAINDMTSYINGDAVLINYDGTYINLKRITILRSKHPYSVLVDSYIKEMPDDEEAFDRRLHNILNEAHTAKMISTLYITGEEFSLAEVKRMLAKDGGIKHAYIGKNLYAQGACFSVLEREHINYDDFRILSEDRTVLDVSVLIDHNGKNTRLLLSKAGTNWQAAGTQIQCLLDDINIINFVIVSASTGQTTNYSISLESFPKRKNKTTKVEITLLYTQKNRLEISVRDLGFGDFFKSSGKVIKDVLAVDNYN